MSRMLSEKRLPNERQMQWYRRGKTAFFHFGVNTYTNKEWGDGTESPAIFNPTKLDCRQWIATIKEAGFTCAILTAKHHDGFCLWPSRYTEHSVKNSPYKNGNGDVVREFVDACREFGIQPGLYLSPWDRNFKEWGTEKYNDYYAAQLTELMTEYGDIYECWWDGAGSTEAVYDWKRWVDIVRQNQPNCVIFGSLGATPYVDVRWAGNELGRAGEPCWATIDESSLYSENARELNTGKFGGERFIPAECNTSIRPGWFYHPEQDNVVKSSVNLTHYWFSSAGKNTGILLNIPPNKEGLLCEVDVENLLRWEQNLKAIFEENLLDKATVHTETTSDEWCPAITYKLEQPVEFNCIRLEEAVEFGHRIREFQVEYSLDGEWETLLTRECIGFCRSELFDTVKADCVRVRILSACAEPILHNVGVYMAPADAVKEDFEQSDVVEDLMQLPTVQVTKIEDGYEIELGGIYAYNTVICDAADSFAFEVFAFNGTRYEPVFYGQNGTSHEICRFNVVEGSYKLKVLFYECPIERERQIQVLNV